jgi:hypothetical protein
MDLKIESTMRMDLKMKSRKMAPQKMARKN